MDDKLQALFASFRNEKDREFIEEAMRIQSEAEKESIRLRLLGSLAFRLQCPRNAAHFEALERRITDIDFAASTSNREKLLDFLNNRDTLSMKTHSTSEEVIGISLRTPRIRNISMSFLTN